MTRSWTARPLAHLSASIHRHIASRTAYGGTMPERFVIGTLSSNNDP